MWKELYNELKIESSKTNIPKTTSAMLDKLEESIHRKLPKSYREFMIIFGPGELAEYFRIYGPGKKGGQADLIAFIEMNREIANVQIETYGEEDFIKRMIPFSDTIGGDVIAWDPSTSNEDNDDYAIFMLPNDRNSIIKLSPDFEAFITKICLSTSFGKIVGDPKYKVSKVFRQF